MTIVHALTPKEIDRRRKMAAEPEGKGREANSRFQQQAIPASFQYLVAQRLEVFGISQKLSDTEKAMIARELEHAVDSTARLLAEHRSAAIEKKGKRR